MQGRIALAASKDEVTQDVAYLQHRAKIESAKKATDTGPITRADEDVGDPPLVRPGGLVPAVCLRLGGQGLAVQPGAAELAADGPLGDLDPVPVVQDRGDLRGGPAGQLQAQRGGLGEQLRVRADRPGVGPRRGPQRLQAPISMPGSTGRSCPASSGAVTVGVLVIPRGDLPRQRASAPRSAAVSRAPAASAITAQQCKAISSCPLPSMPSSAFLPG